MLKPGASQPFVNRGPFANSPIIFAHLLEKKGLPAHFVTRYERTIKVTVKKVLRVYDGCKFKKKNRKETALRCFVFEPNTEQLRFRCAFPPPAALVDAREPLLSPLIFEKPYLKPGFLQPPHHQRILFWSCFYF